MRRVLRFRPRAAHALLRRVLLRLLHLPQYEVFIRVSAAVEIFG
jgi:hypothetical protein